MNEEKEEQQANSNDNTNALMQYIESQRERLKLNAFAINEAMHSNWFTIAQFTKKTAYKEHEGAYNILQALCLADYCLATTNADGTVKYKISINLKEKIDILQKESDYIAKEAELRIKALASKIALYNQQLIAQEQILNN